MKVFTTKKIVVNDDERKRIENAVHIMRDLKSLIDTDDDLIHLWEALDDACAYLVAILEGSSF